MSDLDQDIVQELECRPRRPLWQRVLKWTAVVMVSTLALVIFAGVMLYNFGGMWGSADSEMKSKYQQLVASGQAPALSRRFVIPIPGCVCHSSDPVLTAQHARRRMRECGKCHNTDPAHLEPGVE